MLRQISDVEQRANQCEEIAEAAEAAITEAHPPQSG